MKFAIISAIAAIAQSAKTDFPKFDLTHAHCQMEATFETDCSTVYASLDKLVKSKFDPAQGEYNLVEDTDGDYVWATRTTPNKKYTDDVMVEVQSSSNGTCHLVGKSKSQALSVYDYEVNYCNVYNLYRSLKFSSPVSFSKPTTSQCNWIPIDNLIDIRCSQY